MRSTQIFLSFFLFSLTNSSGVDRLVSLIDAGPFPSALIESHLSHARSAVNSKERTRYRDLDCDRIIDTIDSVERSCSGYRWSLLKAFMPDLTEVFTNYTAYMSNVSTVNKTMFGDPLAINGNEVVYYGLSRFINLQSNLLYGGQIPGTGPNVGQMISWKGLAPHVGKIAKVTRNLSNYTMAVLDTEWTNLMRMVTSLSDYVENYNVGANVDGLAAAVADGQETQQDMLRHFRERSAETISLGNSWMQNISRKSNDFQSFYIPRKDKLKTLFKQYSDKHLSDMDKANDKLESVTEYLGSDAPRKFDEAIQTYTETGASKLVDFKAEYSKAVRERIDSINGKWRSLMNVFKYDNGDNIVLGKKSLEQSELDRKKDLGKKFRDFNQNTTNVVASMRLDDAADLATITDTTNNMTNTILDYTFQSQDSITKVSDQAGKLRDRITDNSRDLRGNLDNLLQELSDGTGNQQAKISEFLKMAADSDANELAALVASAANMRLSLGDDQTAAQAAVDSLIVQLQSKLASQAKQESNVSYEVQSALQVGQQVSFAKLKAAKDALDSDNESAIADMNDAAGGVLEWVQDASKASDKYAKAHRDFLAVLGGASDVVNDQADVSDAQAKSALSKIFALANNSGKSSTRSASDASEAARGILATLQQVRSGSISVNQVTILRDGSLRDKLSKIANQLGMSDDAVGDMFKTLVDSVSADANSQISSLLMQKLTSAKSMASKLGGRIDTSASSLADLNQQTQMTDERSLQLHESFKSQLGKFSSVLDRSFGSINERNDEIKRSLTNGLERTGKAALNEAKKAVNAITDSRQSLVATVTDQADNDIERFNLKVKNLAKSQFEKIGVAFETIGKATTDRNRLNDALTRESSYFSQFLEGAWKSAKDKHELVDRVDRMFTEFTEPTNSTYANMSAEIAALDSLKHVLLEMEKSVGGRIEKSMKVIQDSFLMTESQLAEKAKMLRTMANASLTDEQRAELELEAANLEKSHTLMQTYNAVQSQALSQIFAHNAALLGDASGTVGNLQDIANSVSGMLNSNDKVNAIVEQGLKASGLDADTMMNQMASAITGTSTSIQQIINSNNTQNGFSNNITTAQMNALLGSAGKDANLANQVAEDLTESSSAAISEKQQLLAQYAAMLQENQAKLSAKAAEVMNNVNQSGSNFTDAIKANQMDQTTQLVLVKNAVQQLLQLWSQYADQQGRKFTRWNETESQFYDSFTRELASKGSQVFSQYSVTGNDFNQTKAKYESAISNFTGFLDHVNTVDSNIRQATDSLNKTTQRSASQLGERIYQVDVNDKDIDDEGREAATEQLDSTDSAIDARISDIVNSFKVKPKRRGSFVELNEDTDVVSDEYLTSLESQVEALENKIYDGELSEA